MARGPRGVHREYLIGIFENFENLEFTIFPYKTNFQTRFYAVLSHQNPFKQPYQTF